MTTTTTMTGNEANHAGNDGATSADAGTRKKTLPTHELFDVQERPGQRSFWNKVGAAFENRDGSHSILIYQPGLAAAKRLQLRLIDRSKRPLKEGADPKRSPTHELFVVVEFDNAPNDWKRVGVGFPNRDGSLSLIVDNGVRNGPKARFQMRVRRERSATPPQEPQHNAANETSTSDETNAVAKTTRPRTVVRKRDAA